MRRVSLQPRPVGADCVERRRQSPDFHLQIDDPGSLLLVLLDRVVPTNDLRIQIALELADPCVQRLVLFLQRIGLRRDLTPFPLHALDQIVFLREDSLESMQRPVPLLNIVRKLARPRLGAQVLGVKALYELGVLVVLTAHPDDILLQQIDLFLHMLIADVGSLDAFRLDGIDIN